MFFENTDNIPYYKGNVALRLFEVKSDFLTVYTSRGYQPALLVQDVQEGRQYLLRVSAASLADPLEEYRRKNKGSLKGLVFKLRKEGQEQMSKYSVEIDD